MNYLRNEVPCITNLTMVDIVSCLPTLTAVNYLSTIAGDFNLPHMDWNLVTGPMYVLCLLSVFVVVML